jgi:hypothetical protein
LRRQVIDFVGLRFLQDTDNVGGIGEVAEMQKKRDSLPVRIAIEMIYAAGIEKMTSAASPRGRRSLWPTESRRDKLHLGRLRL